nr:MAG TPA: hypothetical protein [Caudoviricetes sp.]
MGHRWSGRTNARIDGVVYCRLPYCYIAPTVPTITILYTRCERRIILVETTRKECRLYVKER